MASRGFMRRPTCHCIGGIGDVAISARSTAATRLRSAVAGEDTKFCGLAGNRTARIRHSTAEGGVSSCGGQTLRRFSQTSYRCAPEGTEPPKQRSSRARKSGVGVLISLAAGLLYALIPDDAFSFSSSSSALNDQSFRKFTVVSNDPISPTSFILTVKPSLPGAESANAEVIRKAWEHGLWSVEFKQPQLQIARNYTPLPPRDGDAPTTLRFLIRRYEGGEVSKYLSRLQGQGRPEAGAGAGAGDDVELRGPHLGFDVAARLGGAGRDVVFLAGGTGVAPALQLARRVLSVPRGSDDGLSVRILWANRSAQECAGCPRLEGRKGRSWSFWSAAAAADCKQDSTEELGPAAPIVQQLWDLEAAYRQRGNTLEFKCVVDGEGSRITAADLTTAVSNPTLLAPAQVVGQGTTSPQPLISSSCHLHSQRLLQNSTEEADVQKEDKAQVSTTHKCSCRGDGATGKNLFMISGPDGFVGAYVGPKVWAAGAERQGPLGGIVGELRKQDTKAWAHWLVLKQ